MLSIGKLGTGHSAYYEQSVAGGAEDYYTGRGEARGWYLGEGSHALGLEGVVEQGDLKHLFRGTHPNRAERWHERQAHTKKRRTLTLPDGRVIEGAAPQPTAAFDLTFSAPKSVSVLWGLTDGPVAQDTREAHEAAVRAAFDYLERTACVTRRGKGGARHLRGEGFVASAFTHRVSRAGDPQLHTHVLIANATRAEGRYTALHGALLYREAKTAGFLYHAALRAELTRRLGVAWYRDEAGPHPEIKGIDRELRELFSKRAAEIAEQLAREGRDSAKAANAAALDTRAAKTYDVEGVDHKQRWITEAGHKHSLRVLDVLGRVPAQAPVLTHTARVARQIAREAFAPDGLTEKRTTFHRRDLIQRACEHAEAGASVSQIERLADATLDHAASSIVQLASSDVPEGDAVRADGTHLTDARADTPFTTRELLDAELGIIASVERRARERAAVASERKVQQGLQARPVGRRLSSEQAAMVLRLTTSGSGVELVVGLAGAGKTFSLDAAHDAWRSDGIEVRGCATALTAAATLQSETGIRSETIAMLRYWHDNNPTKLRDAIPTGGALIVDEAGMTETRDLAFLAQQAEQRGTKLVLVGDHRQLPEIGAGGMFASLVHRMEGDGRVSRLTENRRQREPWEKTTLAELRAGSVEQAIADYAQRDRIVSHSNPDELRTQLAADWLAARRTRPQVAMVAYTNRDVQALNHAARTLLDQHGQLGRKRVTIAGTEWAKGDLIICTKNNRALGLTNGTRGTVTHATRRGLTIHTTDGKTLTVPRDYLDQGHATHGYAATGHKSQGATINGEAFVLASEYVSREWMYVAMSRAKDASRIYIDTLAHDPDTGKTLTPQQQRDAAILDLHDLASRSAAHTLAADQHPIRDPDHLDRNDLRRHLNRQSMVGVHAPSNRGEATTRDLLPEHRAITRGH